MELGTCPFNTKFVSASREPALYIPSVRLVSKRTRRNALPCISIIREQVAFGKFAGRQGDVYTPRRYVTEKRKARSGVEREREREREREEGGGRQRRRHVP